MTPRLLLAVLAPAVLTVPAFAADTAPTSALSAEQAAEVRQIVKEVLADADSRGSFVDGATAGWEKGKFFIKSEDGKYLMNIYGKVQFRYTYNNAVNAPTPSTATWAQSNANDGFEIRRVNLNLAGKLGAEAGYMLELENRIGPSDYTSTGTNTNNNSMFGIQKAYGILNLAEGLSVWAGRFYLPFEREFLISSGSQVAADRSELNNQFSAGPAEGVQLNWSDDTDYKVMVALSNGANSNSVNWDKNPSQFAITGRGEWLAMGSFADVNDNFALVDGDKQELVFGAAGYWQEASKNAGTTPVINNATGATTNVQVAKAWGLTADALWKVANFSFYAAGNIAGAQADRMQTPPAANGHSSPTPWGLEGQVDWRFLKEVDAFVQYNYINSDLTRRTNGNKPYQEVVFGLNYHMSRNVKLTGDVCWIVSGDKPAAVYGMSNGADGGGSGLVNGATATHARLDGQVAARLQCQVSF